MAPIVSDFADYEGTKAGYCAKLKINPHTFDYWRKRVKTRQATEQPKRQRRFIPLPAPRQINVIAASEEAVCFILYLPDGKRLEFPLTTPTEILHTVLQIPC
jgi:hypothetical protein